MSVVVIPEWTALHKRLPKHTLCESHVKVDGRKVCLPVPEHEAPAYLKARERVFAVIARNADAHAKREAARPTPKRSAAKATATIRFWKSHANTKRHRHSTRCLSAIAQPWADARPEDQGWVECSVLTSAYGSRYRLHTHHTKRGRPFLFAHMPDDERACPDVAARRARERAELAESKAES